MSLLKSFEFIPGVKWFETEMHDSLFQHSVFGAIVFLIVSHTDVYKFVGQLIQVKDKNVLMLVHAVVFAVIMYFGSMYLFAPLLVEGYYLKNDCDNTTRPAEDDNADYSHEDLGFNEDTAPLVDVSNHSCPTDTVKCDVGVVSSSQSRGWKDEAHDARCPVTTNCWEGQGQPHWKYNAYKWCLQNKLS